MTLPEQSVAHPLNGEAAGIPRAAALARLVAEGRLHPDVGLTVRGRTDGAGVQALTVISAITVARAAGCRYLHSPFVAMGHAEGSAEHWAERWERFLNLGEGESPVPPDAELVPFSAALAQPEAYGRPSIVLFDRTFGFSEHISLAAREIVRSELRARYWRSPKGDIPSHRAPGDGLTVALHVRRGDVTMTRHARRFVPTEKVMRQLARLRRAIEPFGRPTTVNLYSEGDPRDFRVFADDGCHLHISESPFESFHNMVAADILMGAPSAFSFVAAFLSEGIVLDARRRIPPLDSWLRRRANGDIPIRRLRRALAARMSLPRRCVYRLRLVAANVRRWRANMRRS